MRTRLLIMLLLIAGSRPGFCQKTAPAKTGKPLLDTAVLGGRWPSLGDARMSNDGNYMAYPVENVTFGKTSLVIREVNGNREKTFPGISDCSFTADNRNAVFLRTGDSLCMMDLETQGLQYIQRVSSYELCKGWAHEWLAYRLNEPGHTRDLVIKELGTGKEQTLKDVADYTFNAKKNILLLNKKKGDEKLAKNALCSFDLLTGKEQQLWQGQNLIRYTLENAGTQLVFSAGKEDNLSLWYYQIGQDTAKIIATGSSLAGNTDLVPDLTALTFSNDGKKLFFNLMPKPVSANFSKGVAVDVWSYTDKYLQDDQLRRRDWQRGFAACVDPETKKVVRLQEEGDTFSEGNEPNLHNNYTLVIRNYGPDFWWQKTAQPSVYLLDMRSGTHVLLKANMSGRPAFNLSPGENYVVYYDPEKRNYFSYEIANGVMRNMTRNITASWTGESPNPDTGLAFYFPEGIAGWLEDDQGVLIYNNHDIWMVDPKGIKKPVNITNGYGYKHKLQFRLLHGPEENRGMPLRSNVVIKAFDLQTKNIGFYSVQLDKPRDPVLLSSGPYAYEKVFKARDINTWVLSRENATEFPNYFATRDFKTFRALSDFQPQKDFNWLTSELISFPKPDGSHAQGILYKPENFDPKKKYPVIFCYYELESDELNHYQEPWATHDEINIPWFVCRGYLVCMPDIHYRIGYPGQSAVNAVESAAKYLGAKPWVDGKHMGIQGHSFGGFETNFIVTHSHLFAAAAEGAGDCDFLSGYGALFVGRSRQFQYEVYPFRVGASLWQRPDLYIANSPLFRADRVTTPLLIMHNKNDPNVPWAQGVEFFTALRRLNKKVWMLQYDNGTHDVSTDGAIDFTIRITQFFDHYLKGAPPPKWMTVGVPARLKGIDSGLGLDTSGRQP